MPRIPAGTASYLIDVGSGLSMREDGTVIRETQAVLGALRHSVGDFHAMRVLRALLAEVRHADVNHLNDVEVVETIAGLVAAGWVWLSAPTDAIDKTKFAMGFARAPAAEAPAPRAASPSPRSAPSEAAEPSFVADLETALLAGMLKDASKDGVPFCEECAKAARAA